MVFISLVTLVTLKIAFLMEVEVTYILSVLLYFSLSVGQANVGQLQNSN